MKKEKFNFTEEQMDFINGLLLSDGTISKTSCALKINTSSYEFAKYIFESLPCEIWGKACILKQERIDERTKKTYITYRLYTHSNEVFKDLRNVWYVDNKKVIPENLIINSKTLLSWYIGDGCVLQNHIKNRTNSIKLCTNSFKENEINKIILPQLEKYDARIMFTELRQPVIIIPRKKCDVFLKDIGKCPFSDYSHKWKIYPYKNKKIEEIGEKKTTKEEINKILELYDKGITTYKISKLMKLDRSLISFYLKKSGKYIKNRDKKKYKIEHDGKIIIIDNLKEYCQKENLCYENMLKLCSGKIRKYKNFKIEKI